MRRAGGEGAVVAGEIDHKRRDLFRPADPADGLAGDEGGAGGVIVAGVAQALVERRAFDRAGADRIASDALLTKSAAMDLVSPITPALVAP